MVTRAPALSFRALETLRYPCWGRRRARTRRAPQLRGVWNGWGATFATRATSAGAGFNSGDVDPERRGRPRAAGRLVAELRWCRCSGRLPIREARPFETPCSGPCTTTARGRSGLPAGWRMSCDGGRDFLCVLFFTRRERDLTRLVVLEPATPFQPARSGGTERGTDSVFGVLVPSRARLTAQRSNSSGRPIDVPECPKTFSDVLASLVSRKLEVRARPRQLRDSDGC